MELLRSIYLNTRFFIVCGGIIAWFCIAFFIPALYLPGLMLTAIFGVLVIADMIRLYSKRIPLQGKRTLSHTFSMGDDNVVEILMRNLSKSSWETEVIDELPVQFQIRDFSKKCNLKPFQNEVISYNLKPLSRGEYHFGNINILVNARYGFIRRRIKVEAEEVVKVYPSIISMKQFELYTVSKISRLHGIKKMRRIGLSYEFEQIKNYVMGDDTRQINWKATGRHQSLMINQFEDEKSQPIYSIIDKSRIMLLPFNGMSLMDYAINATLVLSNVALKKHDKAGLITFSDKIGSVVKADRKHGQLQNILESLYNQKERDLEANYELLYYGVRNMIKTRSLVFLYTNFESMYGLKRVMPVLRKINQQHLLIVVFFENTELEALSKETASDLKGVYTNILAEQAIHDKYAIAHELNNLGIQCLLTKPEELSLNTINKYLEIKSRGMI